MGESQLTSHSLDSAYISRHVHVFLTLQVNVMGVVLGMAATI